MPKLEANYSTATFAPAQTAATVDARGKKATSIDAGYGVMRFFPGSPFGGSDWVNSDPRNARKKQKKK